MICSWLFIIESLVNLLHVKGVTSQELHWFNLNSSLFFKLSLTLLQIKKKKKSKESIYIIIIIIGKVERKSN